MHQESTLNNHSLSAILQWGKQHVSVNPARIQSLTAFISSVLEKESSRSQEILIKISLWIFALDDVFDANDYSLGELRVIANCMIDDDTTPLLAQLPAGTRIIVEDIKAIEQELLSNIGMQENENLHQYWLKRSHRTVLAMLEEAARKQSFRSITIEEYLETGRESVAITVTLLCLFYTMDRTFFEMESYPLLDRMLELSAEIIRLLNDQRSYDKELTEKKLNGIYILQQGIKTPEALTKAIAQANRMIGERMAAIKTMMHANQNQAFQRLAKCILAINEATEKFYARKDFI